MSTKINKEEFKSVLMVFLNEFFHRKDPVKPELEILRETEDALKLLSSLEGKYLLVFMILLQKENSQKDLSLLAVEYGFVEQANLQGIVDEVAEVIQENMQESVSKMALLSRIRHSE